ncbi:MAG: hypothetical protein AAF662_06070 [Pseudomonadota bacterium]
MNQKLKTDSLFRSLLIKALVSIPWLLSLYMLYYFETTGVWEPETPYRALLSVMALATGLALSFLVHKLVKQ